MKLTCYDCGSTVPHGQLLCPVCGSWEITEGEARPTRQGAAVDLLELVQPWTIIGKWPAGTVVLCAGPPGSGKSSIAASLQPSYWFTNEQEPGPAAETHRRCGRGNMPTIHAFDGEIDDRTEWAISDAVSGLLVFDSITAVGPLAAQLKALKLIQRWVGAGQKRWALVIQGVDKADKPAGLRQLEHRVDAAVTLAAQPDGTIVFNAHKNRSGPVGSIYFTNDGDGVGQPELPYSYSVEGPKGRYWLAPYPTRGCKWDGLLRKEFEGDEGTVTAGLASAAKPVRGYPRGVLEPQDVKERRRFAELHGLTWLEPA